MSGQGPFGEYLSGYSQKTVKAIFSQENRNKNSYQGQVSINQNQTRPGSIFKGLGPEKSRTNLNQSVRGPMARRTIWMTDENRVDFCQHFLKMFIGSFVEPLNRNKS